MNQMIEMICSRRSIRKFDKKLVEDKVIEDIISSAMNAPSACNQQIRHYIIVNDKHKLTRISEMHSGISFLKDAPLAIIVCGEPGAAILDYFWEDDCAAATQNILLSVHALGLGATWSGINRKSSDMISFVQNVFAIPAKYIPFSIIAIGYPDEVKKDKKQYMTDQLHYNLW